MADCFEKGIAFILEGDTEKVFLYFPLETSV